MRRSESRPSAPPPQTVPQAPRDPDHGSQATTCSGTWPATQVPDEPSRLQATPQSSQFAGSRSSWKPLSATPSQSWSWWSQISGRGAQAWGLLASGARVGMLDDSTVVGDGRVGRLLITRVARATDVVRVNVAASLGQAGRKCEREKYALELHATPSHFSRQSPSAAVSDWASRHFRTAQSRSRGLSRIVKALTVRTSLWLRCPPRCGPAIR